MTAATISERRAAFELELLREAQAEREAQRDAHRRAQAVLDEAHQRRVAFEVELARGAASC
jgi:hypothetical protein